MNTLEDMVTAGLAQCHACGAEHSERDRFCRKCGACQRLNFVSEETEWLVPDTRPMPHYSSFSGALVNRVTEGVSTRASSFSSSPAGTRWTMRLAGALVAVPLWLMILMLSPLEAYVAARAIAYLARPGTRARQ
jgi:hypothetical protein